METKEYLTDGSLLLGAIIGDMVGSTYESSVTRTKDYSKVRMQYGSSFTDDTVCTIAVAEAILENKPFVDTLVKWCSAYPNRGYGENFRNWIENPIPYSSWGNGSGMRVSPIGFAYPRADTTKEMAIQSAEVSHNHPEGLKGAYAIALAIYYAREGFVKSYIKEHVLDKYYPEFSKITLDKIRPDYKFDVSCQGSVPHAILCFLESKDYEDCIKLSVSLGGDSDTIAAMAGGIAIAFYKEGIPEEWLNYAKEELPFAMQVIISEFDEKYKNTVSK